MLCAEATTVVRRKYALSVSSWRSAKRSRLVVDRLMLMS